MYRRSRLLMLPLCRLCHPCHGRTQITKAIILFWWFYCHILNIFTIVSNMQRKIRVCHYLTFDIDVVQGCFVYCRAFWKSVQLSKSRNLLTLSANNHQTTSNCWTHLLWSGQAGLEVTVCQPHWSPAGQLSQLQQLSHARRKVSETRGAMMVTLETSGLMSGGTTSLLSSTRGTYMIPTLYIRYWKWKLLEDPLETLWRLLEDLSQNEEDWVL